MFITFAITLLFALALLFAVRLFFLLLGTSLFVSSWSGRCLEVIVLQAAYAPIIVAIVATSPMTMPAVSPL
jgi:hypothetical protein